MRRKLLQRIPVLMVAGPLAAPVTIFDQGNRNCRVTVEVALPNGTVPNFELRCEQLGTSNQCQHTLGK